MKTLPSCICIFGLAAAASAGVPLMDQVGADDGSSIDVSNATGAQYFEAAYSIYSIATLDDFDNASGSAAGMVQGVVTGWNGYTSIDAVSGIQVNFYMSYEDAAVSLVGYASSDHVVDVNPNWAGVGGDLVDCSGSWGLNAGVNYVAVIPSNEFAVNGQTALALSFLGDLAYWQANPGGGFGMPNNWQEGVGASAMRVMAGGPIDPCDQPLGPCPDDITGDGYIDVNDVLAVIGTFGEVGDGTFRPAGDVWPLPNGDCLVDVNDLLSVIGVFGGDCLPTGACCSVNSCVDGVKEADCTDAWLGEGSTCADCVSGACCADDASCTYVLEADCAGTFNAGMACADVMCMAAPANNSCSGAEMVMDGDTAIDNTTATSNGDADFNVCDNFGEEMVYNDIWFSYTATCDGAVTISLCDLVDFDSRLSVYDACGGVQLGCNDDCGGATNALSSELSVMATTGDTLIIRVGNFAEGAGGTGVMNVSCQGAAPGACCVGGTDCIDDMSDADCAAFGGTFMGYGTDCATTSCGAAGDTCADAIAAVDGANPFSTIDATDSGYGLPDDTMCAGEFLDWTAGNPDVWMRYDIAGAGTLTVSLCDAASYDTSLVLYSGTDCAALTQIACNGDTTVETGCQAYYSGIYDLPVSAGAVYIRIGGWQGAVGAGTCTITFTEAGATGACCVAGTCVGEITLGDCDALGGLWFNGEMCADVSCPAVYAAGGCDADENVDFGCVCFVDGDDSETDCNGGTNLLTPTYTALTLGQSVCGTSSVWVDGPTGGTYRDLDWWTNSSLNAGGTFNFTIGADSTCLILMVNLDTGTVDWVADHYAGYMNTTALTLAPANWAAVATVSDWNTAWTCGSGLETYTMQVD